MKSYKIALYPGDGIGVEVMDQAKRVLESVQEDTFTLTMEELPWGVAYHEKHNRVAPEDFLEQLREFDAILLGSLGDPRHLPDPVTLKPLIAIRQGFEQYACVRPARRIAGTASPLVDAENIDLLVVRENSEGEYVTCGGGFRANTSSQIAIQTAIHSRSGIERILRFGFEQARKRRRKLTMITKSNALVFGMTLWDAVLETLQGDYSDVQTDKMHVDAAAMNMVRRPESFDVIVASNLFGDILSDLAGAIVGGLGLLPSANINPDRDCPSMFEPVHGSALDIVGQNVANPAGMLFSAAMMLEWLGESRASSRINRAVEKTIVAGQTTPDLGGRESTESMGDHVLSAL